jgi:hypothetical protein
MILGTSFVILPKLGLAQVPPPIQPGNTGRISFPMINTSTIVYQGASVTLSTTPVWLQVQPSSLLGPVDVYPGYRYEFTLDFLVGNNFSPTNAQTDIDFKITIATTSTRITSFNWHLTSQDGLRTTKATCTDNLGNLCGYQIALDTTPPQTTLQYMWATYADGVEVQRLVEFLAV